MKLSIAFDVLILGVVTEAALLSNGLLTMIPFSRNRALGSRIDATWPPLLHHSIISNSCSLKLSMALLEKL